MNLSASRRTWEEASSPAAVRLAKKYEQAWRDSEFVGKKPDLRTFLDEAGTAADRTGARLALLRADMTLRWDSGEKVGAAVVSRPSSRPGRRHHCRSHLRRVLPQRGRPGASRSGGLSPAVSPRSPWHSGRVLEIHELVGTGTTPSTLSFSSSRTERRRPASRFPRPSRRSPASIWWQSWAAVRLRGCFWPRSVSSPIAPWPSRSPGAARASRRRWHGCSTPTSYRSTRIAWTRRAGCICSACRISDGSLCRACWRTPRFNPPIPASVLAEALDRLDTGGDLPAGSSAGRLELSRRTYSRAIAWWCARLAEALAHAHDRGVLHRDIKPSNVLVTSDGMPMLLDFNLAREPLADDGTATDPANLGGTIDYMAPEHLKALGEPTSAGVDGRADIYGMGVLLYEALTGKRPFSTPRRGSSVIDALLHATEERRRPLPRVREQHPEIPPPLEAVIRRCLEPEPRDRYQTAAELAADLQAAADDFPLAHTREPWPRRAVGWVRRRRRRLASAAVILLAALIAAVVAAGVLNERTKDYRLFRQEYKNGLDAYDNGEFRSAKIHYQAAAELAGRYSQTTWSRLLNLKMPSAHDLRTLLTVKVDDFDVPDSPEEIEDFAKYKLQLAIRNDRILNDADALFAAAKGLRFRLQLGEGNELISVFRDLQEALEPFRVLTSQNRGLDEARSHAVTPRRKSTPSSLDRG